MAEVVLTKDNFTEEVLDYKGDVLVDFWATWCGPCRMLSPVIEEIAKENEGKIKVGKINTDEEPDLCRKYLIESIPTLMFFRDGKLVNTTVGYQPKEEIEKLWK